MTAKNSNFVFSILILSMFSLGACRSSDSSNSADPLKPPEEQSGKDPQPNSPKPNNPLDDTPPGFAKFTHQCGTVPGVQGDKPFLGNTPGEVKYCVFENSPNPRMTLWFFHGLMDDETVFENPEGRRASYRDLMDGIFPVRIVTVSYGTLWMFSPQAQRTKDPVQATVQIFRDKIISHLESQMALPKPWVVMGHSMGGYSAAILCASLPNLWEKCVITNALLPSCDPFTRENVGGLPPVGGGIGGGSGCNLGPDAMVKDQFTAEEYAVGQPLALLQSVARIPKTYITACAQDNFGLFTGSQAWFQLARSKRFDVTWDPVSQGCDHYHWSAQKVLAFLRAP